DGTWAGGGTSDDTTGTAGAAGALDDGVGAGEAPTDGPSDEGAWTVGASDEDTSAGSVPAVTAPVDGACAE
ncbi:hypothetical protein, partial [Streptomyces sp. AC558_RSS880]|uniref:hypothetical protein n=1 Tax=Streptomyces sp. AC558_RSS880 TaxID=2823687 RepID=UPI001C218985